MEMKIKNLHAAGIDVGSKVILLLSDRGMMRLKSLGLATVVIKKLSVIYVILELRLWLWKVLVITGNV
jgi:hypothetical protein